MRYCTNCHRLTVGQPLFCNFCGRSFNLKLCPARHPNPRTAEVCSECGSRDLSTPQPRPPFRLRILFFLLARVPGVVLLVLSLLLLAALLNEVANNQQIQFQLMIAVLLLALLWWVYMQIPGFVRSGVRRLIRRRSRRDRDGRS